MSRPIGWLLVAFYWTIYAVRAGLQSTQLCQDWHEVQCFWRTLESHLPFSHLDGSAFIRSDMQGIQIAVSHPCMRAKAHEGATTSAHLQGPTPRRHLKPNPAPPISVSDHGVLIYSIYSLSIFYILYFLFIWELWFLIWVPHFSGGGGGVFEYTWLI